MKNVLIINQSSELYGADKAILELINNFPEHYNPIVVLENEGPLKELLKNKGIQVIQSSVIKVKRGILKPTFFIKLPFEIIKSIIKIKKALKGKKIDLIHSNATSVFIGAFYSFFFRIPHLWHVHEIIEKPKRIALIYPKIINFFSDKVIFNSVATSNHFTSIYPKIRYKSSIIYNGQERNIDKITDEEIAKIKTTFSSKIETKIIIGLIGRISKIKGQDLMLEAFIILQKKYDDIHLVFIGSAVKGKEEYLNDILDKIEKNSLQEKVSFVDFQENIWPYYDAIDITIVPSTEKESFGLVATEAMLSKKPVIAANHGGLVEIVNPNETGLLFEANNAIDLSEKIGYLIENPELIKIYGENGFNRVSKNFSTKKYVNSFTKEYEKLTQ
jgi:glycosyltransferase involved in cell wall biosynthesis